MLKKKVIIPLIVVLVVVVIAWVSLRGRSDDVGISVTVEPAGRHTVIQTVTATGKIQPMTQVNISADVSAKITRLDVKEGDWVEKGTLLLQLDRERYAAAVASAEANLAAAEANANLVKENMTKARKDHDRSRQLYDKALESEASLDSSYAAAEVEAARHQAAVFTDFEVHVPLEWAVIGVLFCTLVGLVAGMWPAVRASRLQPIEALQQE